MPRAPRAFTIVELAVVVAIIALMAGIAIPRMASATTRYQLDFAARRIVVDIARARANARLTGVTQTLTFDLTLHRYTVTGTATGTTRGTTVDLTASPFYSKIVSASFGGSPAIAFDVYGQPVSGGTVVIKAGAVTRTVTLDGASGQASWN
jgi:prepilin-type N-terminal cleavage/methylation domain-containing protein